MNSKLTPKKLTTVTIQLLALVVCSLLAYKIIIDWDETAANINYFLYKTAPFLIGFMIAYILNPFMNILLHFFKEKLHIKSEKLCKVLAILLSYFVLLGGIYIVLLYIVPQLIGSLRDIYNYIPGLSIRLTNAAGKLMDIVPNASDLIDKITVQAVPHILDYTKQLISNTIPKLYSISISLIQWTFNLIIAFMVSIYMLSDKHIFSAFSQKMLYAFFRKETTEQIIETAKECNNIFGNFIVGKAVDSLIIGIICLIAMNIMGLDYAVLISVIVGILNMIPYFGPFIGAIPGAIILGLISPKKMILFIILILMLQLFDGWILGPKILSNAIGLRPIAILFSITVAGAYFGPIGMFLGAPVFAVLVYLFEKFITSKLRTKRAEQYVPEDIMQSTLSSSAINSKTSMVTSNNSHVTMQTDTTNIINTDEDTKSDKEL